MAKNFDDIDNLINGIEKPQYGIGQPDDFSNMPTVAAPQPSGIIRRGIGDQLVSAAKGTLVGIPQAAWGLGNLATLGTLGRAADTASEKLGVKTVAEKFGEANQYFQGLKTPELQAAEQRVAETEGFLPSVGAYVKNPSTIASGLAENLPGMFTMAGLGRLGARMMGKRVLSGQALQDAMKSLGGYNATGEAATAAGKAFLEQNTNRALVAAAGGEGAFSAGQNIAQSMEATGSDVMSPQNLAMMGASGLVTGMISRMSGGLAKRLHITDPDVLLQGINTGKNLSNLTGVDKLKAVAQALISSAITEGALEELPQSAQEQYAMNVAEGKQDPWEGVAEAGAAGLVVGAAMGMVGAGAGAIRRTAVQAVDPVNANLDKEISSLNDEIKQETGVGIDIKTQPATQPTVQPTAQSGLTMDYAEDGTPLLVGPDNKRMPVDENDTGVIGNLMSGSTDGISSALLAKLEVSYEGTAIAKLARLELDNRARSYNAENKNIVPTAKDKPLANVEDLEYKNNIINNILSNNDDLAEYARKNQITADQAKATLKSQFQSNVRMIQDEARRKQAVNVVESDNPTPFLLGGESTASVATGTDGVAYTKFNEPIKFKYGVVEADSVETSHDANGVKNPKYLHKELQTRPRADLSSITQVNDIANKLNFSRVADDSSISSGAPMIGPDSMVEVGNGRVAAIRLAYNGGSELRKKKAAGYKQDLINNAEQFGLNKEQVAAMNKPILVRERLTNVNRKAFTRTANLPEQATQSIAEKSHIDAEDNITDAMLAKLDYTGDFLSAGNRGFVGDFVDNTKEEALVADGLPTKTLVTRLIGAMFAKAYDNMDLTKLLTESTDTDINILLTALSNVSHIYAKLNADYNKSDLNPTKDIVAAVNLIREAKAKEMPMQTFLQSIDLFETRSASVQKLAVSMEQYLRSPARLENLLSKIGMKTLDAISPVGDLFATGEKVTQESIVSEANKEVTTEYEQEKEAKRLKEQAKKAKSGTSQNANIKPESERGGEREIDLSARRKPMAGQQGLFEKAPVKAETRKAPPIQIISKSKDGYMDISFDGGKPFNYKIPAEFHDHIEALLRNQNYPKAKEFIELKRDKEYKPSGPLTEEQKQVGLQNVRKILETLQFKEVRQNPYNKKFKEYYLTEEQWQKMKPGTGPLTGATLQQTMGPNFKDLYYSPMNRPYVLKEDKEDISFSVTDIDKRLLKQGRILEWGQGPDKQDAVLTEQDLDNLTAQRATRLMSLSKDDYEMVGADLKQSITDLFAKKGDLYERTIGTAGDRGLYDLPSTRERQGRAVEAQKSAFLGTPSQANPQFIQRLKEEREIKSLVLEMRVGRARLQQLKDNIIKGYTQPASMGVLSKINKLNNDIARVDAIIAETESKVPKTLSLNRAAYADKTFAVANELARANGYELIPINDATGFNNAFVNHATKQIFVRGDISYSYMQLVGHELSHVGTAINQSNKETQALIDVESAAFKKYREQYALAIGIDIAGLSNRDEVTFTKNALAEYAADLQGNFGTNYDVTLSEGLTGKGTVDVIGKGVVYEETKSDRPEEQARAEAARNLIEGHDFMPMLAGAAVREFEKATGRVFPYKELIKLLDSRFVEVSYSNKRIKGNTLSEYDKATNTLYINQMAFGEDADVKLEDEIARQSILITMQTSFPSLGFIPQQSIEGMKRGLTKQDAERDYSIPLPKDERNAQFQLKNDVFSFRKTIEPFIKDAPQNIKNIIAKIDKSKNSLEIFGYIANRDFASWLDSIPDFSSKFKKEGVTPTFWDGLKRISLNYADKVSATGRTKLDELTGILDRTIDVNIVHEIPNHIMAEARKFPSAQAFIRRHSYWPTGKKKIINGVECREFNNGKITRYEPVSYEEALSTERWKVPQSDKAMFEALTRNVLKLQEGKGDKEAIENWDRTLRDHIQPIQAKNDRLNLIWETAHGVTTAKRTMAIKESAKTTYQKGRPLIEKSNVKFGTFTEEEADIQEVNKPVTSGHYDFAITKAAQGITLNNVVVGEAQPETKKPPVLKRQGIDTLPTRLRLLARGLVNIKMHRIYSVDNQALQDASKKAIEEEIRLIYPEDEYGDAFQLRLLQYQDVIEAVDEAVALREEPFILEGPTEAELEAEVATNIQEENEAWARRNALMWQRMFPEEGIRAVGKVPTKEQPVTAPAVTRTNKYRIKKEGYLKSYEKGGEARDVIGTLSMDVMGDYIRLHSINANTYGNATKTIARVFKLTGAKTIKGFLPTTAPDKEIKLWALVGAQIKYNELGWREFELSREQFGKYVAGEWMQQTPLSESGAWSEETLPEIFKTGAPLQEEQKALFTNAELGPLSLKAKKKTRATKPVKGSRSGDLDLSARVGPITLPSTPKELEAMLQGNWMDYTQMPPEKMQEMKRAFQNMGGLKYKWVRELFSLPFQNSLKSVDWERIFKIFGVERVEKRDRMSHELMRIGGQFLNRRDIFKKAGYTKAQRDDADVRLGKIITYGDENLRNDLNDLQTKLDTLNAKIAESPLFNFDKSLIAERDAVKQKVDKLQTERAYSWEQVQDGIVIDGKKIKLSKLEYDMYKSVRDVEDALFNSVVDHMQEMLYANYKKQKWFGLLSAALTDTAAQTNRPGGALQKEDTLKLVEQLKGASNVPGISKVRANEIILKFNEVFKRMDAKLSEKDKLDAFGNYAKIASQLAKEFGEIKGILKEFGIADNELNQITKDLFVAFQRTKPRLQKIKNMRNSWRMWPGFFPRKRTQGGKKLKIIRESTDDKGEKTETEVYSAMFNNEMQLRDIYSDAVKKVGQNGKLPTNYKLQYEAVNALDEFSFEGMKDFNLQAIIDTAFEGMKGSDYFDAQGNKIDIVAKLWDTAYEGIAGQFQQRGAGAHGIHRKQKIGEKAIKGYIEGNHDQILIDHITSMTGLLTKQEAAYAAMEVMSSLEDKTRAPELRKYIRGQLRNNTTLDRVSSKLRSFAFLWYLGGMIKSAAVNSTQPIIVGIPMLDNWLRERGLKSSGTVIQLQASADIARNGGILFKDPEDWGNIVLNKDATLNSVEKQFLEVSLITGAMAAQHVRYIKGQTSGWGRNWNRTFDVLATPFSSVEKFNRMTSGLAMFRTAYAYHLKNKGTMSNEEVYEAALKDAHKFINQVHYPMGQHNMPALTQTGDKMGAALTTAYVFRTFTHNFLLNQFNLLRSAARLAGPNRSDLEIRQQATNDLITVIHTMALMALFGGMLGLPFLKDIFDWTEKKFGYSPKQWVRTALRGAGGNLLETFGMNGLPGLLGVNLSGSLGIGILGMSANGLESDVFGVWGGLYKKAALVKDAAMRGDAYRAMANISPEFIRGPIVALTESDFGKETLGTRGFATTPQGGVSYASTGKPLSLSGGQALARGLGFQPTEYSKEREIEQSVRAMTLWAKEEKKRIAETFKVDRLEGNANASQKMFRSVQELNAKIRERDIPEPRAKVSLILKAANLKPTKAKRRELRARRELAEYI